MPKGKTFEQIYGVKRAKEIKQKISKTVSNILKESWKNPDFRNKRINAMKGKKKKPFTEQHKRNISLVRKGKSYIEIYGIHRVEEEKQKRASSNTGKKRTLKTKQNISIGNKGIHNEHKGKTYEQIYGSTKFAEREKKKRSRPCLELTKIKISSKLIGIKRPYSIGEKNPACRKDVREKISETRKELFKKGVLKPLKGDNNPSKRIDVKLKISKANSKEKNGMWNGGTSYELYDFNFSNSFKRDIKERDNYFCQLCGKHESVLSKKLAIHHIDYNKKNTNIDNCITLCNSCHSKTMKNREYWKTLFFDKLQRKKEMVVGSF